MNLEDKIDNRYLIAVTTVDPIRIDPGGCVESISEVQIQDNCYLVLFGSSYFAQRALDFSPEINKKIFPVTNVGDISCDTN
tara:strand:- start:45 stop:287 length:243 start_codon:yes stop_codon:yes gene_type:complete